MAYTGMNPAPKRKPTGRPAMVDLSAPKRVITTMHGKPAQSARTIVAGKAVKKPAAGY